MEIEFGTILRAIRRFWWIPVVLALVFGALGAAATSMSGDQYVAETQMLITPPNEESATIAQQNELTRTYQGLIETGSVLDLVMLELDLDMTPEELADSITVSQVSGTQILKITVTHSDPQAAADIANSITKNTIVVAGEFTLADVRKTLDASRAQVEQLNNQIATIDARLDAIDTPENEDDSEIQAEIRQLESERFQLTQTLVDLQASIRTLNSQLAQTQVPVTVLEQARVPEDPVRQSPILYALVGAIVGAVVGAAIMVARELFDSRVLDVDEMEETIGAPAQLVASGSADNLALPAARVQGQLASGGPSLLVAPHTIANLPAIAESLGVGSDVTVVNGLLGSSDSLGNIQRGGQAVIAAPHGGISREDLENTVKALRDMGVQVVGGVLLK